MKRFTRLFAFMLVTVLLFTVVPFSATAASEALSGKTLVALGDSLTRFGTTASGATSSTGEYTYPYYLSTNDYLGVPVINVGVGGDTTNHVMARFEKDVLSKNPDLVMICIGMNDQAAFVANGEPNIPLETYRNNLVYFVTQLQAIGSDVIFVTPSPVNTNSGYYVPGAYGLDYSYGHLDAFCNAMREVAIEYGCSLVDINYECDFEDLNKFIQVGDGIHHSDYGRKQYAKYISDHLYAVYDGVNKATMTVNCVDANGNILKTVTHIGARGAHITLASPEIRGYETADKDIETTFKDGETFTYVYSLEVYGYLEEAKSISANDYSEDIIALIREAAKEAETLVNSGSAVKDIIEASEKLGALIDADGNGKYVVSAGASYTATEESEHETYADDGIRLTDGVKGAADGSSLGYSGWSDGASVSIDLDLGAPTDVNSFSVYCASGQMSISKPAKLTVYISEDGKEYTEVATQTALKTTVNTDTWDTTVITAVTEKTVKAQYIRYTVTPNGDHVWIDEVEAAITANVSEGLVYITGINRAVEAGDSIVFTPDFGTITAENANHRWTANVVAKRSSEKDMYVVTSVSHGNGDSTPDITLAEDEILIATHSDEATDSCIKNKVKVNTLEVGQEVAISGIDIESAELDIAPYISIIGYKAEAPIENGKVFWVTHFNTGNPEGAGTIFTNEYSGCGWWYHVSFKPVEGLDNVYEVVEKTDGTSNGKATPLTVPEGGFVWAVNTGNDYITLNKDPEAVNYTSQASKNALAEAKKLKVGDRYIFSGLNLDTKEAPTTTPYIDWFSSKYVCTAVYAPYVAPEPEYTLGDVDLNGTVDTYDYLLVKRCYFGTVSLGDIQLKAADVNENGTVDTYDYMLVKRIFFGTYTVNK